MPSTRGLLILVGVSGLSLCLTPAWSPPRPRSRRFITKTLDTQRKQIERTDRTEEAADTDEEIEQNMHVTKTKLAEQFEEKNAKKGKGKARQEESEQEDEDDGSDFDKMSVDSAPAAKRGAKGKAAPKASGKKKGSTLFNEESDNDEEDASDDPPPKRKAAASTSKKAAATTTSKAKKAAAPTQSQLAFAPSRSSTGTRATAKTATSKNKKSARVSLGPHSQCSRGVRGEC